MYRKRQSGWQRLIVPSLLIAVWFAAGATNRLNTALFPSLNEVWQALIGLVHGGLLASHVVHSLKRVLIGFGLAIVVGVPLGLFLGLVPKSEEWLGPVLHFLRQIPPTTWIPVFLLWFGIGESLKHAVIFYAAVFPIVINTSLGVQQIPKEYWEVSEVLCLSRFEVLTKLVLPGSYDAILTGLRLGMGISWRAIVAAEMLAATSGLGYLIMSSRALVRVDQMFAGIILIGLIGVVIDNLFDVLQKRMISPWKWQLKRPRGEAYEPAASAVGRGLQEVQRTR